MRTTFVLVALLGLSATGCHRKQSYAATPLLGSPIHIVVNRAYTDKERLFVETQVTNVSDRPMTIERNNVELALDNGQLIGRSYESSSAKSVIEPGATRAVRVDFRGQDVKWRNVRHAKLEWSNAVSIEGRQVLIPPMDLSAQARDRDRDD